MLFSMLNYVQVEKKYVSMLREYLLCLPYNIQVN